MLLSAKMGMKTWPGHDGKGPEVGSLTVSRVELNTPEKVSEFLHDGVSDGWIEHASSVVAVVDGKEVCVGGSKQGRGPILAGECVVSTEPLRVRSVRFDGSGAWSGWTYELRREQTSGKQGKELLVAFWHESYEAVAGGATGAAQMTYITCWSEVKQGDDDVSALPVWRPTVSLFAGWHGTVQSEGGCK